jgi:L-threonylcarbamoyladenylate synthase
VVELCEAYGKPLVSTSANLPGSRLAAPRQKFWRSLAQFPGRDGATGGRQNPSEIRDALTGELFRQG